MSTQLLYTISKECTCISRRGHGRGRGRRHVTSCRKCFRKVNNNSKHGKIKCEIIDSFVNKNELENTITSMEKFRSSLPNKKKPKYTRQISHLKSDLKQIKQNINNIIDRRTVLERKSLKNNQQRYGSNTYIFSDPYSADPLKSSTFQHIKGFLLTNCGHKVCVWKESQPDEFIDYYSFENILCNLPVTISIVDGEFVLQTKCMCSKKLSRRQRKLRPRPDPVQCGEIINIKRLLLQYYNLVSDTTFNTVQTLYEKKLDDLILQKGYGFQCVSCLHSIHLDPPTLNENGGIPTIVADPSAYDFEDNICPECKTSFCFVCAADTGVANPIHDSDICKECRDLFYSSKNKYDEKLNEDLKKNNMCSCPKCGVPVDKDGGCDHMECNCGTHFCWICKEILPKDSIYKSHLQFGILNDQYGNPYETYVCKQRIDQNREQQEQKEQKEH